MKIRLLLFFFVLALTACGTGGAVSPEGAALQNLNSMFTRPGEGELVAGSAVVRQSTPVDDTVYLLVTYRRTIDGRLENCSMVYQTRKRWGLWDSGGSGGGCDGPITGAEDANQPAMTIGGGTMSNGEDKYSHVSGLIENDQIVQVRVTWNDGLVQSAAVVDHSFLIARTGQDFYQTVEGLDSDGSVIYSTESPAQ